MSVNVRLLGGSNLQDAHWWHFHGTECCSLIIVFDVGDQQRISRPAPINRGNPVWDPPEEFIFDVKEAFQKPQQPQPDEGRATQKKSMKKKKPETYHRRPIALPRTVTIHVRDSTKLFGTQAIGKGWCDFRSLPYQMETDVTLDVGKKRGLFNKNRQYLFLKVTNHCPSAPAPSVDIFPEHSSTTKSAEQKCHPTPSSRKHAERPGGSTGIPKNEDAAVPGSKRPTTKLKEKRTPEHPQGIPKGQPSHPSVVIGFSTSMASSSLSPSSLSAASERHSSQPMPSTPLPHNHDPHHPHPDHNSPFHDDIGGGKVRLDEVHREDQLFQNRGNRGGSGDGAEDGKRGGGGKGRGPESDFVFLKSLESPDHGEGGKASAAVSKVPHSIDDVSSALKALF